MPSSEARGDVLAVVTIDSGATDHLLLTIGGRTLFDRTLSALRDVPRIREILVLASSHLPIEAERTDSRTTRPRVVIRAPVTHRLRELREILKSDRACERVLLHDADRPLVTADGLTALLAESDGYPASVAAVPVKSSFKRVEAGTVVASVPRSRLHHLQTPWVFERKALLDTLERVEEAGIEHQDLLKAMRAGGVQLRLLRGHYFNVRITEPAQRRWAEQALARQLVPRPGV